MAPLLLATHAALAAACALVSVLAVPFAPPGLPLLLAGLVAVLLHWRRGSRQEAHR